MAEIRTCDTGCGQTDTTRWQVVRPSGRTVVLDLCEHCRAPLERLSGLGTPVEAPVRQNAGRDSLRIRG